MSTLSGHPCRLYEIACEDGSRHLIYNAAEISNPPGHEPDKW